MTGHDARVSEIRDVAVAALRQYDVAPRRVSLAAESFNSVFRVVAISGTYALRVGAQLRIHADGALEMERAWLDHLADEGVAVAGLLPNRSGEPGTQIGSHTCVLFEWVHGRSMRTRLTAPATARLGELSARLHADAEAWGLPNPPEGLAADRVLTWRLPHRVIAREVPGSDVFKEALDRAQEVLDELWRAPPHPPYLLHGDLTPANVIVARDGTLVPIDFQDLVCGFDVQDLAISVAALRRVPGGARLVDAFRSGYEARRRWPDTAPEAFEALIAARALNQINLTLNVQGADGRTDYLTAHEERLRAWLGS
jgi:Ser/Thr protein kinase RdoA (MazF antagonist)